MPTKRHRENLAVSGDGISFAELKHAKPDTDAATGASSVGPPGAGHEVVQHDHNLDRSETGDALQRAVERVAEKRGQGN